MIKKLLPLLILLAAALGCSDDGYNVHSEDAAVYKACKLCQAKSEDMEWLRTLIQDQKDDMSKLGDIYAVSTSQGTVFIHQPMVMSCWACIRYTCDGNFLVMDEQQFRDEVPNMPDADLLYRPRY